MIETVLQLIQQSGSTRVLLVAPSNSAADVLTTRLASFGLKASEMHRFIWAKRKVSAVPTALLGFTHQDGESGEFSYLPLDQLLAKRVIVSTSLASGLLHECQVPQGHFTHILVDEAGQALEPELFVPFQFTGTKTQIMLAGDPHQLGAVVRSRLAAPLGLGTSLQERLLARSSVLCVLVWVGRVRV